MQNVIAMRNSDEKTLCCPESANRVLTAFVEDLFYHSPDASDLAKHALLAVQIWIPDLKGSLKQPWNALRNWQNRMPKGHRTPMPYHVLLALVAACFPMAAQSGPSDKLRWIAFSMLLRVSFHGLLRPAEYFALRVSDVKVSPFVDGQAVLVLRDTKTSLTMGRLQHVVLEDPATIAYLRWFLAGSPPDRVLWPFSASLARRSLSTLLIKLQLAGARLTLGSLRAGGATHLYSSGMEVSRLMFKGRWKAIGTLHCYIQEATCALVSLNIPNGSLPMLQTLAAQTQQRVLPPSLPLSVLCPTVPDVVEVGSDLSGPSGDSD